MFKRAFIACIKPESLFKKYEIINITSFFHNKNVIRFEGLLFISGEDIISGIQKQ